MPFLSDRLSLTRIMMMITMVLVICPRGFDSCAASAIPWIFSHGVHCHESLFQRRRLKFGLASPYLWRFILSNMVRGFYVNGNLQVNFCATRSVEKMWTKRGLSLSIRRFWGKRGKREAKMGEIERSINFSFPLPLPHLKSPLPLGTPDTQSWKARTISARCHRRKCV